MIRLLLLLFALVLLIALLTSVFIVRENEQVVVTQLGRPVRGAITTPGLQWKFPWPFERRHSFDKRFLEWQGDAEELPTRDKVFIFVDTYARWRISDPLLFFQRLRDERSAQSRLDDILDGETRNAIARHDLIQVIRSSNREPAVDEASPEGGVWQEVEVGRGAIRDDILAAAKPRTEDLGIEILDVQFKRINYSKQVEQDVFNRMISERRRIADRYRSQGQGEASRILGSMERELKRIESEAFRKAEEIRGRADAEATAIYAGAYNQSADSREFYGFLKSLETLRATTDPKTSLVLSTDGDLYRYLESSD